MKIKADESKHIKDMRGKLEKKFEAEGKRINKAAIGEMKKVIQHWIARHQSVRVPLYEKTVELFDENRHSAQTSKYIGQFTQKIKKKATTKKTMPDLKGRISSTK